MTRLMELSTKDLLERFIEICVEMGTAAEHLDTRKFNRLFDRKSAIVRELRSRPGDRRRDLFALYAHENLQVRLTAANNTYPLDPDVAIAEFRAIHATGVWPQATDAGMALDMLELGIGTWPNDPWI